MSENTDRNGSSTPGPWQISDARTVDGNAMVVGGDMFDFGLVAEVVLDADARLIVAAPDMLEALKEALELAKLAESLTGCRGDDDYVWGVQDKISSAISKATRHHPTSQEREPSA